MAHDGFSIQDFTKDNVFAVEPAEKHGLVNFVSCDWEMLISYLLSDHSSDEELRSIGVFPGVGHAFLKQNERNIIG